MKNTQKKHEYLCKHIPLFLLLSMSILLTLSACGASSQDTSRGSGSTSVQKESAYSTIPVPHTGGILTAFPILQKSVQSLSTLKSLHFAVKGKGTLQASGNAIPAFSHASTYTLTGQGDIVPPTKQEQMRVRLTYTTSNSQKHTLKATEILSGQKVYLRGQTNPWFAIDLPKIFLNGGINQSNDGAVSLANIQALLPILQNMSLTDNGVTLEGQLHIRHLSFVVDQQALSQVLATLQQSQIKQMLGSVQLRGPMSIDLFLDETSGLPHRLAVKGKAILNIDTLLGTQGQQKLSDVGLPARTVTSSFDTTITITAFNQPVALPVPEKSIPLELPALQNA